jgi:DNA replication protein DnaC
MRKKLLEQMEDLKIELVDNCSICQGNGFVVDQECSCRIVQRYLNYLIEAKIPTEYWDLTLDDLTSVKPQQLIAVAQRYIDKLKIATRKSLGMLLMGPNGRGKTSLQCAIGKSAVTQGYSVQYFTAQQYVEAVKSKDVELLEEYESGKIILFDELDKVYIAQKSNFVAKILEEFIRRMISSGVAFIICTNLVEDDLGKMFGESTMSMLRGHLRFLTLAGEDYRKTQNADWLDRLEDEVEYMNHHVMEFAYALHNREVQEEAVGWEKEY